MSRSSFYPIYNQEIEDLQLDTANPRIRHGSDQADCIERLMRNKSALLNLVRDIAENGLTPEHILVSKTEDGKWRVRDGNRRIVSIKLLNRPSLAASDSNFATQVTQIANDYRGNIPSQIDCIACDDEGKILDYLERKHTGENSGIGQKGWEAMLISLFKLSKNETDQHRRAAQLLLWAETQNLPIEDNFPITTLTRGLTSDTLALIGFRIENDSLLPYLPVQQAYALASRVINDIASGRINVSREGGAGSIYSSTDRDNYFKRVRDEIGPPLQPAEPSQGPNASPDSSQVRPPNSQGYSGAVPPRGTDPNPTPAGSPAAPSTAPSRSPSSPSTLPQNRKCLFGPRKNASPGIPIPASEIKAQSCIAELRKLDPHETPLATSMLIRALIELSNNYYRGKHSLREEQNLHTGIASSAEHMKSAGLLTQNQLDAVLSHTRGNVGMLHIKTLQAHIHRTTNHPNGQLLNTLWDELSCFVTACWR